MCLVRTPIMQNTSLLTPTKEDYYKVSIKVMSLGTGEIRSLATLLGPPVGLLSQKQLISTRSQLDTFIHVEVVKTTH